MQRGLAANQAEPATGRQHYSQMGPIGRLQRGLAANQPQANVQDAAGNIINPAQIPALPAPQPQAAAGALRPELMQPQVPQMLTSGFHTIPTFDNQQQGLAPSRYTDKDGEQYVRSMAGTFHHLYVNPEGTWLAERTPTKPPNGNFASLPHRNAPPQALNVLQMDNPIPVYGLAAPQPVDPRPMPEVPPHAQAAQPQAGGAVQPQAAVGAVPRVWVDPQGQKWTNAGADNNLYLVDSITGNAKIGDLPFSGDRSTLQEVQIAPAQAAQPQAAQPQVGGVVQQPGLVKPQIPPNAPPKDQFQFQQREYQTRKAAIDKQESDELGALDKVIEDKQKWARSQQFSPKGQEVVNKFYTDLEKIDKARAENHPKGEIAKQYREAIRRFEAARLENQTEMKPTFDTLISQYSGIDPQTGRPSRITGMRNGVPQFGPVDADEVKRQDAEQKRLDKEIADVTRYLTKEDDVGNSIAPTEDEIVNELNRRESIRRTVREQKAKSAQPQPQVQGGGAFPPPAQTAAPQFGGPQELTPSTMGGTVTMPNMPWSQPAPIAGPVIAPPQQQPAQAAPAEQLRRSLMQHSGPPSSGGMTESRIAITREQVALYQDDEGHAYIKTDGGYKWVTQDRDGRLSDTGFVAVNPKGLKVVGRVEMQSSGGQQPTTPQAAAPAEQQAAPAPTETPATPAATEETPIMIDPVTSANYVEINGKYYRAYATGKENEWKITEIPFDGIPSKLKPYGKLITQAAAPQPTAPAKSDDVTMAESVLQNMKQKYGSPANIPPHLRAVFDAAVDKLRKAQ